MAGEPLFAAKLLLYHRCTCRRRSKLRTCARLQLRQGSDFADRTSSVSTVESHLTISGFLRGCQSEEVGRSGADIQRGWRDALGTMMQATAAASAGSGALADWLQVSRRWPRLRARRLLHLVSTLTASDNIIHHLTFPLS